jgi:hypothetical protein
MSEAKTETDKCDGCAQRHVFKSDVGYIVSKLIDQAHDLFWFSIGIVLLISYVQGVCLAQTKWGTFGTIIFPPYAWLRSAEYTVNTYYDRKGPCSNDQHPQAPAPPG